MRTCSRRLFGAAATASAVFLAGAMFLPAQARAAARKGREANPTAEEEAALEELKVKGKVAWSTSRESGLHDIFIMNADGTEKRALTESQYVDWFSRFSADGEKVIFNRSKMKWVSETNAKYHKRWAIWMINADGTDEKQIIDNATWGTWTPDGRILFSRGPEAYVYDPDTGEEKLLIDGAAHLHPRVVLQQPQMSPDSKYVAITLRGRMRETGVWDIEKWSSNTRNSGSWTSRAAARTSTSP
jgi:Tol biopolymer transport system component